MSFYETLLIATTEQRNALFATPVIDDCLKRCVSIETYAAFLTEAYHHVRHTVPLLMACGSRLPERHEKLRDRIVRYIGEEHGHERWILGDLRALGIDAEARVARGPSRATELMVSYAYDITTRRNPVGFFGMVFVLEGTSVAIATRAARIIQEELGLPESAFTYLLSHGAIDVGHIERLRNIIDGLDCDDDRAAVMDGADAFFTLYRGVFESLPRSKRALTASREVA